MAAFSFYLNTCLISFFLLVFLQFLISIFRFIFIINYVIMHVSAVVHEFQKVALDALGVGVTESCELPSVGTRNWICPCTRICALNTWDICPANDLLFLFYVCYSNNLLRVLWFVYTGLSKSFENYFAIICLIALFKL